MDKADRRLTAELPEFRVKCNIARSAKIQELTQPQGLESARTFMYVLQSELANC